MNRNANRMPLWDQVRWSLIVIAVGMLIFAAMLWNAR